MIIYKDIISGDEMFTDSYKMKVTDDGIFYEVEGNLYSESTKVDDSMFGGNKSAEATEDDDTEESSVSGCSIVVQNRLVEQFGVDKKSYKKYIRLYTNAIVKHLKDNRPGDVDQFKANAPKAVEKVLKSFDDWTFYHGQNEDFNFDNEEKAEGMLALLGYRGVTPYMLFFKDGLEEEKA